MKEICLSQGLSTTVDDDKYDWLVSFGKWYARKSSHTFYAQRNIRLYKNRKILQMHRLIINAQPGQIVDHINQNALDNRKDNYGYCKF